MKEGQGRFNLEKDIGIRSGLELLRESDQSSEFDGEKVLFRGQGAYDAGSISRSSWKMGFLHLTGSRLIFTQGNNRMFDIALDSLKDLQVIDRDWIPGKSVQQLRLTKESNRKNVFFLSLKEPEQWIKAIETVRQGNIR